MEDLSTWPLNALDVIEPMNSIKWKFYEFLVFLKNTTSVYRMVNGNSEVIAADLQNLYRMETPACLNAVKYPQHTLYGMELFQH